jgi:nucleotide-binding universal stress UspA family protein
MKNIKTIVVPIDFSSNSKKLTEYAFTIANSFGAVINFINVVPDYPADAMIGAPYGEAYQEKALATSQQRIASLVEDSQQVGLGCSGDVVCGNPVDKIVEYAEQKDADLLVISTHGVQGIERIMMGSVAEHVLRKSPCPVLIMNPHKKPFHS